MKRRAFLGAAAATVAACAAPSPEPSRVAKILASLSLDQRAGQTMAIAFHGSSVTSAVEDMIRSRGLGGIVLRAENAPNATALRLVCADLQRIASEAKIPPLFLALDQEGGSVVRIGSGMTVFTSQMGLAATPDPVAAVQRVATITAGELRANGVNWNFAPVADVNNEPLNPIIGNPALMPRPAFSAARSTSPGTGQRRWIPTWLFRSSTSTARALTASSYRPSGPRSPPACRRSCSRTSSCRRSIRRHHFPRRCRGAS
jgi:hypothetical protein